MPELESFMFGDPSTAFDAVDVVPPTDYDPINPTPIMLMSIGPEPPKPVCATLKCPHGVTGCIEQGFCDDEYMLWHERPHIWQGDYA